MVPQRTYLGNKGSSKGMYALASRVGETRDAESHRTAPSLSGANARAVGLVSIAMSLRIRGMSHFGSTVFSAPAKADGSSPSRGAAHDAALPGQGEKALPRTR